MSALGIPEADIMKLGRWETAYVMKGVYRHSMMEKEEIEAIVKEVLKELEIDILTAKEKGKVMKALMPKVKGKADGKLVNEVVASMSE